MSRKPNASGKHLRERIRDALPGVENPRLKGFLERLAGDERTGKSHDREKKVSKDERHNRERGRRKKAHPSSKQTARKAKQPQPRKRRN